MTTKFLKYKAFLVLPILFFTMWCNAQEMPFVIGNIKIEGNKATKAKVIYRELMFKEGDTLSEKDFNHKIKRSRENLLNTSLFNFVKINFTTDDFEKSLVDVIIDLQERWYIIPEPILDITSDEYLFWLKQKKYDKLIYGVDLGIKNSTGYDDNFNLKIQFGKNKEFTFNYTTPFVDKQQTFKTKILFEQYSFKEQGAFVENDKMVYISDESPLFKQKNIGFSMIFRPRYLDIHELSLGITNLFLSDTLLYVMSNNGFLNEKNIKFLTLSYLLKIDKRDIKYYPLNGAYFDVLIKKSFLGFNFESEKSNNLQFVATFKKFNKIYKNIYANISTLFAINSLQETPFYFQSGLGYNNIYVRGYQSRYIEGDKYFVVKSNLKYNVLPTYNIDIKWLNMPKFSKLHLAAYVYLFADYGFVNSKNDLINNKNNILPNNSLFGTGIGIDIVTYYDRLFRLEYAVNRHNHRGFYLHFVTGL